MCFNIVYVVWVKIIIWFSTLVLMYLTCYLYALYYMQIEYCRVGGGRMRRRAVRVPVDISSRFRTSGVAYCLVYINITVYGKLISPLHTSYY